MREIRFRAWEKIDGKWVLIRFQHRSTFWATIDDKRTGIIDPEQYTGVKDFSGNEVCEGDVLRDRLVDITVSWDEERAGWYPFCRYDELKAWHPEENRFDIIGNLHENPELLEDKNEIQTRNKTGIEWQSTIALVKEKSDEQQDNQ